MSAKLTPETPEQLSVDGYEPFHLDLVFDRVNDRYLVVVEWRDSIGRVGRKTYGDLDAKAKVQNINKRNFSGANPSLRQLILQVLQNDATLPPGTISDDGADLE